ncbi:hypothetical protein CHUAL_004940 [Chamberlinius hualienensis]
MGFNGKPGSHLLPTVVLPDLNKCRRRSRRVKLPEVAKSAIVNDQLEIDDDCIDQESFLRCLNLVTSPSKRILDSVVSPAHLGKYFKNGLIPFDISSNLGQKCITDRHLVSNPLDYAKYEKFCFTSTRRLANGEITTRDSSHTNYIYTFIPKQEISCHKYCFTHSQRAERLRTINMGLNKRARLLKLQCREMKIVVKRLSVKEVMKWTTSPKTNVDRMVEYRGTHSKEDDGISVISPSIVLNKLVLMSASTTKTSKECPSKYVHSTHSNGGCRQLKDVTVKLQHMSPDAKSKMKNTVNGDTDKTNILIKSSAKNKLEMVNSNRSIDKCFDEETTSKPCTTHTSDNSDSDIEIVYVKVDDVQVNKKEETVDNETTVTYCLDAVAGNKFNLYSKTIFRCIHCQYKCRKRKTTIQEHVKSFHPNWKEVKVVHKLEFDEKQQIYYKVLEAYPA